VSKFKTYILACCMLFGYNGSLKHDCKDVENAVTGEIMRTARRLRLNKQGPYRWQRLTHPGILIPTPTDFLFSSNPNSSSLPKYVHVRRIHAAHISFKLESTSPPFFLFLFFWTLSNIRHDPNTRQPVSCSCSLGL